MERSLAQWWTSSTNQAQMQSELPWCLIHHYCLKIIDYCKFFSYHEFNRKTFEMHWSLLWVIQSFSNQELFLKDNQIQVVDGKTKEHQDCHMWRLGWYLKRTCANDLQRQASTKPDNALIFSTIKDSTLRFVFKEVHSFFLSISAKA